MEEVRLIELLMQLAKGKAQYVFSDILLHEDSLIKIKTPEGWTDSSVFPLDMVDIEPLLNRMDERWRDILGVGATGNIDPKFRRAAFNATIPLTEHKVRYRCSAYLHGLGKIGISVRNIPMDPLPLAKTGLPPQIADFADNARGLILVTGPTSSGKSTTQSALLHYINSTRSNHILTLEDPIEYIHESDKSIFTQREIPTHVPSFKIGLEESLRQTPDVIAIGEIRDKETMETCLNASESGHLVIATMHTNSVAGTLHKVMNFFNEGEKGIKGKILARNLIGVISQCLVPTIDRKAWIPAYEIIENQQMIAAALMTERGDLDNAIQQSKRSKAYTCTLNETLKAMVEQKKISPVSARAVTYDLDELNKLLATTPR